MSSTVWELFFIVALLIANGILSMSEMSIISARKSRLRHWADEGNIQAAEALKLANEPSTFLSTVQVGITLVGVLAGAFSGATLSEKLSSFLSLNPLLAPYSEAMSLTFVVGLITVFSLIFGELVPKRLALSNPERVASFVASPMKLLSKICLPLVFLLSRCTDIIFEVLRMPLANHAVTPAEIEVLVEQGTEAGEFEESEQEMVAGVLRLDERRVGAIMTPRRDLEWLDINESKEGILNKLRTLEFSRYPVANSELDNVLGIVETRKVWIALFPDGNSNFRDLLEEPLYVPESTTALELLEMFREQGKESAFVMDEYGILLGLVTQHDLFVAIVGETPPLGQVGRSRAIKNEDGSWLVDGTMPVDAFGELFEIPRSQFKNSYQTLAGLLLDEFEDIPEPGEKFSWNKLCLEIMQMDKHRIDKVLVRREKL